MNIDLQSLNHEELKKLRSDVDKALKTLDARRKVEARQAAERAAKEFGFSLDEIADTPSRKPKAAPRYRNPDNPQQTWTGRGRRPQWFNDAIEAGRAPDDMKIGK